jgi:hypothetical protein
MAGYGGDVSVYVEDRQGDQGFDPMATTPFWLSPDVDIPAHTGEARQGSNDVRIRVHTHEEPILAEKITAEVYVGQPSLVMSPTMNTRRIDPGNLVFRPPGVAGTEPIADIVGGTVTFPWTPSNDTAQVDGPGHRCLVVRAFPQSVAPPTDPFAVPTEIHEAQHNIDILATTKMMVSGGSAGAGTPHDPRRQGADGLWHERISTTGAGRPGLRYVVWAFDPAPAPVIRHALGHTTVSKAPPAKVTFDPDAKHGNPIDPSGLLDNGPFKEKSGLGRGLFAPERLVAGAELELHPNEIAQLMLGFDHTNLKPHSAAVLHGVQWDEHGNAEGGMTVVALASV